MYLAFQALKRGLSEWFFGGYAPAVVASCSNCAHSYVRGHEAGRKQTDLDSWKAGFQCASEQADAEMLQAHERAADYQETLVEFACAVYETAGV